MLVIEWLPPSGDLQPGNLHLWIFQPPAPRCHWGLPQLAETRWAGWLKFPPWCRLSVPRRGNRSRRYRCTVPGKPQNLHKSS